MKDIKEISDDFVELCEREGRDAQDIYFRAMARDYAIKTHRLILWALVINIISLVISVVAVLR